MSNRWLPVVGGLVTTGLGVVVNLATDLKSNVWAWVGVGILTVAGILVGLGSERLIRARRADDSIVNSGTIVSVAGRRNRVKVSTTGPGVVIAIGVVSIVAVLSGLLVGQAGSAGPRTAAIEPTVGPTSSAIEPGNALDVRIDHLRAHSEGWFAVFPRDKATQAREFAKTDRLPEDEKGMDEFFQRELEAGAYIGVANGSPMRIVLGLRNNHDKRIVIRDLTVENKQDGPIADGTAILVEAGGGNEPVALLHLDSAYPVARIRDSEGKEIGAYFANQTITIEPGQAAVLPIDMDAEKASHAFTLAVSFDSGGIRHTHRIDNDGQPFRVTPEICALQHTATGLSYQEAHVMNYLPPDYKPRLVSVEPSQASGMC
jgi:hypothetical protein